MCYLLISVQTKDEEQTSEKLTNRKIAFASFMYQIHLLLIKKTSLMTIDMLMPLVFVRGGSNTITIRHLFSNIDFITVLDVMGKGMAFVREFSNLKVHIISMKRPFSCKEGRNRCRVIVIKYSLCVIS